jgi:hypothetical protein
MYLNFMTALPGLTSAPPGLDDTGAVVERRQRAFAQPRRVSQSATRYVNLRNVGQMHRARCAVAGDAERVQAEPWLLLRLESIKIRLRPDLDHAALLEERCRSYAAEPDQSARSLRPWQASPATSFRLPPRRCAIAVSLAEACSVRPRVRRTAAADAHAAGPAHLDRAIV